MPHATIQGDLRKRPVADASGDADGSSDADASGVADTDASGVAVTDASRSLRLYYDRFEPAGSTSAEHPLVLLIMGLGAQCVQWDADLCQALADRGYLVVRFDNRDI